MNRRDFFGTSAALLGSSFLPAVSAANLTTNKSVVIIHMQGGISAVDFINPIPESLQEYRSTRGAITTKSGFDIGADFPELAKLSNYYSVVRGLVGTDANHQSATLEWMTSHKHVPNVGQREPSYGSIFSRKHDTVTRDGVPHYVKLRQIEGDDASWMGVRYAGMDYGAEQVKNMQLNISDEQFRRRVSFLTSLDNQIDMGDMGKGYTELKEQAVGIIRGKAAEAFKLEMEPDKVKQAYGTSRFAQDLLLARRLIERGTRVVTLNSNAGWDHHSGIDTAFKNNGPGFDGPMAVFIQDLIDRGMLDDVLVVTVSEFSRTKLNASSPIGRDHWARTNSSMMIGGGYNHGRVIGETDKTGLQVVDGNYSPKDMGWTILDHLGIDRKYTVVDSVNRPRHLVDDQSRNILA